MKTFHASESLVIDAPAAQIYDVLADYHVGHAAIVPKKYFKKLEVLEGGVGAGTKFYALLNVYGTEAEFTLTVSEPEPGRVLSESDPVAGITTTFTLEPLSERRTRVTISSETRVKPGLQGWLEKTFTPMISRKIYREELGILAKYVTSKATVAA